TGGLAAERPEPDGVGRWYSGGEARREPDRAASVCAGRRRHLAARIPAEPESDRRRQDGAERAVPEHGRRAGPAADSWRRAHFPSDPGVAAHADWRPEAEVEGGERDPVFLAGRHGIPVADLLHGQHDVPAG